MDSLNFTRFFADSSWLHFASEFLIAAVSVFLTYIFGWKHASKSRRLSSFYERYRALYVPYVSMLYRGHLDELRFSELSQASHLKFLDLLFNNLQFADPCTQKLLIPFYNCCLDLLEYEAGVKGYEGAPRCCGCCLHSGNSQYPAAIAEIIPSTENARYNHALCFPLFSYLWRLTIPLCLAAQACCMASFPALSALP